MSEFMHPLAREAHVWPSAGLSGTVRNILVVITTLDLSKSSKRYKADKVELLSDAAQTWVEETKSADEVLLINRPRDWTQPKP